MRIVVSGTRAFGAAAAQAIVEAGHEIVLAVAPDRIDERGRIDRLRAFADYAGIPWLASNLLTDTRIPAGTDVIVAAHSHAFVGRRSRARATYAIGYHPSLLPLHRGRDAIRWTIRDGDKIAGGSVYHLTDKIDGGPIAAQDWCFVPPRSTPESLWREHLMPMGVRLLVKTLHDLSNDRVIMVAQDETVATWEPSWERPPLHRPELLELPAPGDTRQYIADPAALH